MLGARFALLTGATVTHASCVDSGPKGYEFLFKYENPIQLNLVSTIDGSASPNAQGGMYATIAACEFALSAEKTRFETPTGLQAVFAYCQTDEFSPDRPFAIRIDGFGIRKSNRSALI